MTPPQQIPIPIISDREGICRLTSSNRQKPSEMKVMVNNTARSWVSLTVVSSNRFCLSFTLSELRSTSPKYLIPFLNVKANSKKTMRTRPTILRVWRLWFLAGLSADRSLSREYFVRIHVYIAARKPREYRRVTGLARYRQEWRYVRRGQA